jgi:Ni,Fe-hydrogenase III small subunit/Pyruvate/2-oxoacid:ferredoxin oxidoreductase delta subunit
MFNILGERLHQKKRTITYPKSEPVLPDRYRGRPQINRELCAANCMICTEVCPIDAIKINAEGIAIDLGRCLFCGECAKVCHCNAIRHTSEYRLATGSRQDLIMDGRTLRLAAALDEKSRKLFGRSLKLRQISAAGCNACEADVNVLNTVVFDLGRFGIQFVASPRHADGILVTGCVSRNMLLGLQKTYEAVPDPKLVIAVGACAISGGPFIDHPEIHNGIESLMPVDLYVPGCPPHPVSILDGLLRLLGRIE